MAFHYIEIIGDRVVSICLTYEHRLCMGSIPTSGNGGDLNGGIKTHIYGLI